MEWIDEPDLDIQTEKVTKLVDDYRNLYSDTEVDAGGQALVSGVHHFEPRPRSMNLLVC